MKKYRGIVSILGVVLLLAGLFGIGFIGIRGLNADNEANKKKAGVDDAELTEGISITYRVVGDVTPDAKDMADTVSKLQKRAESYSEEAIVSQVGDDRINVEIPGVNDAEIIPQELGKNSRLYFIAETDSEGNANYSFQMPSDQDGALTAQYVLNYTIEELEANGSVVLTGTDIRDACMAVNQDSMLGSIYVVELTMTEEGTKKFADATQKAYEKAESIAIYYDGEFLSVPSVSGVITDGVALISSMESAEEAEKLASTLRIGELKLELEVLYTEAIGES